MLGFLLELYLPRSVSGVAGELTGDHPATCGLLFDTLKVSKRAGRAAQTKTVAASRIIVRRKIAWQGTVYGERYATSMSNRITWLAVALALLLGGVAWYRMHNRKELSREVTVGVPAAST